MNESLLRNVDLYHRIFAIDLVTAQKIVQAQQLESWERSDTDWQALDVYKAAVSKVMTKLGVTSDSEIMGGEPVVAGTRVPVELVLGELCAGRTPAEILNSYPSLPPGAIEIIIHYAESLPVKHPLAQLLQKYRALCC